MPTIPGITSPQVAPAVPPLVKPYAKGPESFGYGLGSGMMELADDVGDVQRRERQRTDRSASMSAYSDALALRSTILYDEQTGLARQRGRNYLDAAQEADQRWSKGVAEIGARLSPEQQELFEDRMASLRAGFADDLRAGVSEARTQLYDDEMGKVMGQVQKDALASVARGGVGLDPEGALQEGPIQDALGELSAKDGILDTYAPHMAEKWGVSESDARTRMTQEYATGLHSQTVRHLLAQGDDQAAAAYFTAHQEAVADPEERIRLTELTQKASLEGRTQRAAETILADAAAPDASGQEPTETQRAARIKAGIAALPEDDRRRVGDRVGNLQGLADEEQRKTRARIFDQSMTAIGEGMSVRELETTQDWHTLSQDQRDALTTYQEDRSKGRVSTTDGPTWARLDKLLREDPSKLAQINVRELTASGALSAEDAAEVERWQANVAKATSGDTKAGDALKLSMTRHQTVEAMADHLKLDKEKRPVFALMLKEQERRAQALEGRELSDEEFDTLVRRASIKVAFDRPWYQGGDAEGMLGFFSHEGAESLATAPDAIEYDAIPAADIEQIRAVLIEAGEDATEASIKERFIQDVIELRRLGD